MTSLLEQLQEFIEVVFADPTLTTHEKTRKDGKQVMAEVKKEGFALRKFNDDQARPVYIQIQASAERKAVDEVTKATTSQSPSEKNPLPSQIQASDTVARQPYVKLQSASERIMVERIHAAKKLGKIAKSIWIIHTPTVATPCVNEGEETPSLLAEEIMQDEVRKNLTLSRASIIRDYLKAGGILVVAYDKNQRELVVGEDKKIIINGRTPEQLATYEKLMQQYPEQIIDFPIDIKSRQEKMDLKTPEYPLDFIGATYLIQDTNNHIFEMTNLGLQANDPRPEAEWGVWMQNRAQAFPEVTERMSTVFSFLQKAGLNQVLKNHAEKHKLNPDDFAPLLSSYMSLEVTVNKKERKIICKIQ